MNIYHDCITLIGIGGVGGPVCQQIARLIPLFNVKRLIIYDFDVVEERNLEGQVYIREDIGHPKVEAMGRFLYELPLAGCYVDYKNEKFTKDSPLRGIVIVAVDNLKSRQEVFEALDYKNGKANICPLLIEARVGDAHGLVYFLNPNDHEQMKSYRKEVFWDEDPNRPRDNRCVPARIGSIFGGVIADILVKFWEHWMPYSVNICSIDFVEFPQVEFFTE